MDPQVSIIIPVYNTDLFFLERCLNSVSKQSFKDFEVLIVDSSTLSEIIYFLQDFVKQDKRFILIKSIKGVSVQRNIGIDAAKGKHIAFIDSDDYILPNYLFNIMNLFVTKDVDIVFPHLSKEVYYDRVILRRCSLFYKPLYCEINKDNYFEGTPENGLVNPIKVYRRDIIGANRFNTKLSYGEDMLFNYELSKKKFRALYCPSAEYVFTAEKNINSGIKRLNMTSLNIVKILYELYKGEKGKTRQENLEGILYQYNNAFNVFFYACVRQNKILYLIWLIKYRMFYLRHNNLRTKEKLYILFPLLRKVAKILLRRKDF